MGDTVAEEQTMKRFTPAKPFPKRAASSRP